MTQPVPLSPEPAPLYFGPEARPRFGWLHSAAAPSPRLGVVICSPFGYEATCAHRSLRHIADLAASAGVPALRFDYDGTGDSAGTDRDPERVPAWLASIHDAVDALRRRAGVTQVALVGVRLGALLAALACADRGDLAGLVAIAPVVNGRAYVRELRMLQMALGLEAPPPGTETHLEGVDEAVGFALTHDARDALAKVDLQRQATLPAPRVLLLDRDDLPGTDAWAAHLRSLGATVEQRRLHGYVEMVQDPHKAVVPRAIVAATVAFLRELSASPARELSTARPEGREPSPRAELDGRDGGGRVLETATFLEGDRARFAIIASPADLGRGPPRRKGILLVNAGAIHHIGPSRLYVALARRWAARGHTVMRIDVSGIGDSRPHAGEPENVVYTSRGQSDVAAAVAFLRAQPGVVDCVGVGLCSGAYNVFRGAAAGLPFSGIVAINPLTFFWKEGMSLDYPAHKVASESSRYAGAVRSLESWKKLARGEVKLGPVLQVLKLRVASESEQRVRDLARRLGRPFPEDLGADLETIVRRGIDLRFVFASGEPGLDLLESGGRSVARRLRSRGKLHVEIIDGPDHTFTPLWSHDALLARLDVALGI